jgi:AGZA family xanthine/uracil permease-like MFS transporter
MQMTKMKKLPLITKGDIDGFFGLAIDNLVQLILIVGLCRLVVGIEDGLIFGVILPGAAVSLIIGNLYYSFQARKMMLESGRNDICALPYGINTVSLFAYVFMVMLPAKFMALDAGKTALEAGRLAWLAGLVACFGSGLIELGGAFVAQRIRNAVPRAALLSTLAGIALGFISFSFLFRAYEHPLVGLSTLAIILVAYFGGVQFKWNLPGGLVALVVGTLLAWFVSWLGWPSRLIDFGGFKPALASVGLYLPTPVLADIADSFQFIWPYIGVIIPMGVFNVVGSMQNLESAEAAGDKFPTGPSLAVNGIGTLAASIFGSCFPTTIYIGHPGWKKMGARSGYSLLNSIFFTVICLTGTMSLVSWAVPIEAGMAIVIWIGLVITVQAFEATPKKHYPAVVVGLLPGIAAWGALMVKSGIRAASDTINPDAFFSWQDHAAALMTSLVVKCDLAPSGLFSLEQGFIFTSMLLSGMTVKIIMKDFNGAALWAICAALLSGVGLMHSFMFTAGDTVLDFANPAWPWTVGYLLMALVFVTVKYTAQSTE